MELEEAIAQHVADWNTAVVERDVLGTQVPAQIAGAFQRFCRQHLHAEAGDCLFYRSSVGCVAGLTLDDGRAVVVKAHQPGQREARLAACQRVQRSLHARGFPAPEPLVAPVPFGLGFAVAERYLHEGEVRDAHDRAVRRLLANGLHAIAASASPPERFRDLGGAWFTALGDRLWPRPHNAHFNFEQSAQGAEWIDALARRARAVPLAGELVVGHFDWRAEHVLVSQGRITTAYDWDSLHLEREPVVVGAVAHAFTARWDGVQPTVEPTPSLEEMRGFVADYESARGRDFDAAERKLLWSSCVYSTAYTARCEHSLASDGDWHPSYRTFGQLLREVGEELLGAPSM
ncbi:MAG: aminoglycoside phosphotransferase family protein [Myxococcales bacterium]|nr:aminoglycoside phosphotransferase family protein [Myxococcales bacterium]